MTDPENQHQTGSKGKQMPQIDPFLRYKDVTKELGISRSTIERQVRAGTFPPPLRISKRAVGWYASKIVEWKQDRPGTRGEPSPSP